MRLQSGTGLKRFSLLCAIGVSVVFALYDGWLFAIVRAPADNLYSMHQIILTLALVTWVVADARDSGLQPPSFDYGWYVWWLLPIYGPYYLVRTRRWRGVLMALGAAALFLLPWLAEVLLWLTWPE